ncbi:hypothetical protein [Ruegeria atlantica]|uniref:hypothetical protein n=1 Tax=Ruegeria atlantica TaxID=81569 RepID=UPI00249463B6|nr:hypothetical protein [Ruegeria atlantica]
MKHSPLDMWQGRRQKPLVAGKRNGGDMPLGQQLIHNDRMRKMKEAKEVNNRETIMPHNNRYMSLGPDPKPLRPERPREAIFQPSAMEDPSPPAVARETEDQSGGAGEVSNAPKCGGSLRHHERPNHIEAEARKAELAAMSERDKIERKRRTPKRKLTPGKERHVRDKA